MCNHRFIIIAMTLLLSGFASELFAVDSDQEWRREVDLRGHWRFHIGDNMAWAAENYDDSDWELIFAPSPWEDEGYPGYDGYAWYRKSFKIDNIDDNLYIHLGNIDDVDQVYINGKIVGLTGQFPPNYYTGYSVERIYHIPRSYLNRGGENKIAVRVYDAELSGGIIWGRLGIYRRLNVPAVVKSLEGIWKFSIGDDKQRSNYNYDDSHWENILVPLPWEVQGHPDYDGFAWYRIHFSLDPKFKNERLILLLGKIDDLDEAWLNDHFIGRTGRMYNNPERIELDDKWQELRAYGLDDDYLYFDRENVLAVRVYDGMVQGGFYEGPVGIFKYSDYKKWYYSSGRSNIFMDLLKMFNDN